MYTPSADVDAKKIKGRLTTLYSSIRWINALDLNPKQTGRLEPD